MEFSIFSWRKRSSARKRSYQLLAALNRRPRKYQHFASYLQQDSVRGSLQLAKSAKMWIKLLVIGVVLIAMLWAVLWWIQESLAALAFF